MRLFLALILLPQLLFADSLNKLEQQIKRDLKMLNYPAAVWRAQDDEVVDVAIVGGGMRGIALAYALKLEGVTNVKVFDACEEGKEGPWLTTARMKTLRSGKSLQGPALGIPHLTFRAWYEAKEGKKEWKKVKKIPTKTWGTYLQWVRKVLGISVKNCWKLQKITPLESNQLQLSFDNQEPIKARQVVLATGRAGFGGPQIPAFMKEAPKKYWAHTSEIIDPALLKNRQVAVIGAGASAFDAAAFALDHGAANVKMLVRRSCLPQDFPFASLSFQGFHHGYFSLPDEARCEIFGKALEAGIPPPQDSVKRLEPYGNAFELLDSTCVEKVSEVDSHLHLETSRGPVDVDFLILGTGYSVDGSMQPELSAIFDKILLWKDKNPDLQTRLGEFPYLGAHFEFLEKEPAPYLENIYCFNYGAFLSHGRISGDIDCIEVGIRRLVEGIVTKLFLQDPWRKNQIAEPACPTTCYIGD